MIETFILMLVVGTKNDLTYTVSFRSYYPHDISLHHLNTWVAEQEKEFVTVTGCTSHHISSLQFIQK